VSVLTSWAAGRWRVRNEASVAARTEERRRSLLTMIKPGHFSKANDDEKRTGGVQQDMGQRAWIVTLNADVLFSLVI